jgi:hypothetical protein
MVSISVAMYAALGFLVAAPSPEFAPTYAKALATASAQQKPVAVFIGQGTDGFTKLVTDGGVTTEAVQALKTQYVCVYVDTTTEAGKDLAGSFQMTEGLVISDKTGNLQALRHEGLVPAVSLTQYTQTYSQMTGPIARTIYAGRNVIEQRPVLNAVTNVRDFMFPNAPGYILPARSNCPNGKCPNAR